MLKKLTLSGFKSFGKTTDFEFLSRVTAVVGPNGSGKSNVAEAIRWVLGEQSMKSLRGKKGEDLIFNGSEKAARLGRAEVKLTFDNSHKIFPFEFDDVIVTRRVMRDGTNEYLINGSGVRLKDISEMLSKVGLGASQHHIISQGEVDRILWASPKDRQSMIEDALGLREFYMKARDAERKLQETDANVKQVEAQRREIQPHIKYLKQQAEKMRAHAEYVRDLKEKSHEYAAKEKSALGVLEKDSSDKKSPLLSARHAKEKEIEKIQEEIRKEDAEFSHSADRQEMLSQSSELDNRRRQLERELGKIEGLLQSGGNTSPANGIPMPQVISRLNEIIGSIDSILDSQDANILRDGVRELRTQLKQTVHACQGDDGGKALESLKQKKELLGKELASVTKMLDELRASQEKNVTEREDLMADLRKQEHELRERERELGIIRSQIRDIEFSEQNYRTRKEEYKRFVHDLKVDESTLETIKYFSDDNERQKLIRAVDRLRIKLEEAGGIDAAVEEEYAATLERDAFLERELDDLKNAEQSLKALMKELEATLKEQFAEGIKKINSEFLEIFKTVFGGGRAQLVHTKPRKPKEGEDPEDVENEGGIDISLDIPRKRLRSLDMLSGGERALTSVALLFALSTVNPPPFLVLDETDAALDEANSQRYGDMLELLSKKTQLVVITHNRETMRRAGILYGVTLGDDAISRIISLKLEDAAELAGATR